LLALIASVSGVLSANIARYESTPGTVKLIGYERDAYAPHWYSVTQTACSAAKFGCRDQDHRPWVRKPRSRSRALNGVLDGTRAVLR